MVPLQAAPAEKETERKDNLWTAYAYTSPLLNLSKYLTLKNLIICTHPQIRISMQWLALLVNS